MTSEHPVPIERLLEHRAWVQALARSLVADENRADDVAQDAWLAALRHPPRHADALRAWLARLVRHRAADIRRGETRRAVHEETPPGEPRSADPADVVARIEEHERLVRAVLALAEPYRTAVMLRYYDGLSAADIAERTSSPVATVRTRLKRGLAQLRERLDADHGGDGRAWTAALLPLAVGHDLATKSALVQGGIAVTAKTKVTLAVAAMILAALTVSVVVLGKSDERPPVDVAAVPAPVAPIVVAAESPVPPPPAPIEPVAAPSPVAVAPVVETPPAPEPPKAEPAVVAEPVGTATVHGAVRLASTKKPVVGQKVVIESPGRPALVTSTDRVGVFRFEHLTEGHSWRVRVEAAPFAAVVVPNLHLERDEVRNVGTLWLEAPVPLTVIVKDWRDRPIAGATVEVHRSEEFGISDSWTTAVRERHLTEPVSTATTGADGRAVLSAMPRGKWDIVATAAGFGVASQSSVSLSAGATVREVTLRLDRALSVEGRVVDGERRPIARANVWAHWGKSYAKFFFPHATTDDEGRFVLGGLLPGDTQLRVGRDGAVPGVVETVRVPASGPVEIVLDGGIVEGVVTSALDGKPLAGARVVASIVSSRSSWIAETMTGEDGRYRLDTIRAGRAEAFHVERQGFVTFDVATPHPRSMPELNFSGAAVARNFALRRSVLLAGRVTSPEGPVVGVQVVANWISRTENSRRCMRAEDFTDADGRFEFSGVPPTTVVVQVTAEGWFQEGLTDFNWYTGLADGMKPAGSIEVPSAGLTDVKITLKRDSIVVAGRVESAEGAPVAGAVVHCGESSTTSDAGGTFSLDVLRARPDAWISASMGKTQTQQQIQLPATGRFDAVVLRLSRSARIGGRVTSAGGGAIDGASVELAFRPAKVQYGMREITMSRVPVMETGRYEGEFMEREGRLVVRASAPGFATTDSPEMTVESGRVAYQADIVLLPAQAMEGRVVSGTDGRTPVAGARVALISANDDFPWRQKSLGAVTDRDGRFRILNVAAGDAVLDVDAAEFVRSATPLKLPASSPLTVKVEPALEIAGVVTLPGSARVSDVWEDSVLSGIGVIVRKERDIDFPSQSVSVGPDGRFVATRLPRGTYTVVVSARITLSVAPFEMTGVPAGKADLEIVLKPAGEIAGRVIGPDGRPVFGCNVQAIPETGDRYTPSASTKADGTFVIRGLAAGTYRLDAKPPQSGTGDYIAPNVPMRPAQVTGVAAGAKDVEIRMPGSQSIRGTLLGANGKPLANAWVRADVRTRQDREIASESSFYGVGDQTDAAGRFEITGVAAVHYRLVHVPEQFRPEIVRLLRGGDDVIGGASNVRVTVGGVASITGKVVDDNGKPVADASVEATPVGGGPFVLARTDTSGAFTLGEASDLVKYAVRASKPGLVPGDAQEVAPGATGLVLRLAAGLEASGRVLLKDGTPFASGRVLLTLEGSDYRVSAPTDADGRFTAKALKPGVYRVEEVLTVIRYGQISTPRACGTMKAGDRDVELRLGE